MFLWHCSAGKDRAGIATMYVLLALGVEKEEIINNYLKTNEYLIDENKIIVDNVKRATW
ncbi:MAG: tyrosine-protein phosphatase [Clostridium sp.]|nr:MAG: tyrosine-protein phosphatase [Clostridium sp.]